MDPSNRINLHDGANIEQTNNQLHDENYIERLFPKCAPKQHRERHQQLESRYTSNGDRHSTRHRGTKSNGRIQQHPNQQQQQQQQQQPQTPQKRHTRIRTTSQQHSRQARRNKQPHQSNMPVNQQCSTTNAKLGGARIHANSYIDSSDLSENELPTKVMNKTSVSGSGVSKSASHHYGMNSNNNNNNSEINEITPKSMVSNNAVVQTAPNNAFPPESSNTNKQHRTKKYVASKNLQQQLKRSQSSYNNKLTGQQSAVCVDKFDRNSNFNVTNNQRLSSASTSSLSTTDHALAIVSNREKHNQPKSGLQTNTTFLSRDVVCDKKLDKSMSRTTYRGIVFAAEPLSQLVDTSVSQKSQSMSADDSETCREVVSVANNSQQQQQRATASIMAPRVDSQTADCAANKLETDTTHGRAESPPPTTTTITTTHPLITSTVSDDTYPTSHLKSSQTNFHTERIVANERTSKDDDKYIDLFVYDNSNSTQLESDNQQINESNEHQHLNESNSTSSIQDKLVQELNDCGNISPVVYQANHHSLIPDRDDTEEQNVIQNDTSIEELCSTSDNLIDCISNKELPDEQYDGKSKIVSIETETIHDIISLSSNKLQNTHKHNPRSQVSVLQTVDEKAEINLEERTDPEVEQTGLNINQKLVDVSDEKFTSIGDDSTMMRKGFVAPGFPKQVLPAQANTSFHKDRTKSIPNTEVLTEPLGCTPTLPSASNSAASQLSQHDISTQQQSIADSIHSTDNFTTTVEDSPITNTHDQHDNTSQTFEQRVIDDREVSNQVIENNLVLALDRVSLNSNETIINNNADSDIFNLRHHKLPNELSHFSTVRTGESVKHLRDTNDDIPRASNFEFNTLSDGESDDHEKKVEGYSTNNSAEYSKHSFNKLMTFNNDLSNQAGATNSISVKAIDDDAPAAKTALVFPRLDEGLSSDAESCDDDVEDDDDQAMEADVDADDDEEDDDDGEDDITSPSPARDNQSKLHNINMNSLLRDQTSSKPQNRVVGSLQHQQQFSSSIAAPHMQNSTDISVMKTHNNTYSNFMNHESIEQNDLKPAPSYSNQNGQNNYWTNTSNHQQVVPTSTQPTASNNQFNVQRNQHGNNINNSNNNSLRQANFNTRDEAKATNRLSSDTDNETDRLLGTQRIEQSHKTTASDLVSNSTSESTNNFSSKQQQSANSREVLIEGVLFSVKYLGSTHTECEGRGEKEDRINQAEMAVHEVKFRGGESQSAVEVQLFISTEKIMVLDDKHRKIMMDHSLRTISYIADIGDAIVLIVRKKSASVDSTNDLGRPISKTSCHVFESNESHTITKSISQAFQVAYTELLKANGGTDVNSYLPKELDYQEVLNSQEMSMTELEMFARKDNQREVIVPKKVGEILGLSIVESGWGSVLPTAVIASLKQDGPAYRCKKLSVGDQILSINGISLVGLSLAECQKILGRTKKQSVARLSVVPCPITVEVKIKRPDTKYQLGFSVQHGVICSLLRGGIAERGGVRVGHRIISINGTTVVGVPHDKIVTLLASSVGEIRMKTCLTSLYRHMLGEEKNVSFV